MLQAEDDEVSKKNDSDHQNYETGVIYKRSNGVYIVHTSERRVSCTTSQRLRLELESQVKGGPRQKRVSNKGRYFDTDQHLRGDPIVVGDEVHFIAGLNGNGLIVEVLPRRNKLARRSPVPMPTARPYEQVIVANVDQVVPVFAAADPPPHWNLLDRYLVSAEAAQIPAMVIITKVDLINKKNGDQEPSMLEIAEEYRHIGYPVLFASALTGEGLDEIRQSLQGKLSVFLGKSGVGKSTLLNALQPGLGLRVLSVSKVTGKGRHTTTCQEMVSLEGGGAVVDTPGIREFGLWDVQNDDLALYFPELQPFLGLCRFGLDCQHDGEPGCAVRAAVTREQISPRRWLSYLALRNEI